MFHNCNSLTNGENWFYTKIKNDIKIIFDVGCRNDSLFVNFNGIVHYFDPCHKFINELKQKHYNPNSFYNNFGLGDKNDDIFYYPRYESFYNRLNSCKINDDANKIILKIKKAKDYINDNSINTIDFLKIDTEGYELMVLKGFEEHLNKVQIIQFEYGGTFLDNNTKLIDVIDYLKKFNFTNFSYLTQNNMVNIINYDDHYKYCNIVCFNATNNIKNI